MIRERKNGNNISSEIDTGSFNEKKKKEMSSSANSSELINRSTERAEQSYILYNIQMRNELRHRDARGGRRGTW